MHNIQVDRILTEKRGKCWHETKHRDSPYNKLDNVVDGLFVQFYCTCDRILGSSSDYYKKPKKDPAKDYIKFTSCKNPSPTTNWQDYGEVIEWAKGQKWWERLADGFLYEFSRKFYDDKYTDVDIISDKEKGSHALAEFIEREGV